MSSNETNSKKKESRQKETESDEGGIQEIKMGCSSVHSSSVCSLYLVHIHTSVRIIQFCT